MIYFAEKDGLQMMVCDRHRKILEDKGYKTYYSAKYQQEDCKICSIEKTVKGVSHD